VSGDIDLDPGSASFLADPHGVFDALRGKSPTGLVHDPLGLSTISYDASDAAFRDTALVPGIDHLLESLGHGALWGSPEHTLTDAEDDTHSRLRRALTPWFTPRQVARLRERTAGLVADLLDAHDPARPLDVMTELADIVPARVFGWMLGADDADAGRLADWSKALILVFTAQASMVEPVRAAKAEIADYARALLDRKRTEPDGGLASVLAAAESAGTISRDDGLGLLEELLSAAVDNTANTVGCALEALARHPGQWAIAHDTDDIGTVIEECGRFQPAIRHTLKYARADTELRGEAVPAGSFVTVRIAAAHRDPAAFPDPHELDVTRRPARTRLDFGAGRHHCLGSALARMEVEEMVGAVTRRYATASLTDGFEADIVANGHVYRLPLEVRP
jgi:cytochrome P450